MHLGNSTLSSCDLALKTLESPIVQNQTRFNIVFIIYIVVPLPLSLSENNKIAISKNHGIMCLAHI